MSTRAAILRQTEAGPFGVYHHWDGYPTGLGASLWQLYHGHFARNLEQMLHYLIDQHPAGWSTINDTDPTIPAGYHTFSGTTYEYKKKQCTPTPEYAEFCKIPKCYCHGERSESAQVLNLRDARQWSCEWAYVFSLEANTVEVYSCHANVNVLLLCAKLDGPEPDWKKIEAADMEAVVEAL